MNAHDNRILAHSRCIDKVEERLLPFFCVILIVYVFAQLLGYKLNSVSVTHIYQVPWQKIIIAIFISIVGLIFCILRKGMFSKLLWGIIVVDSLSRSIMLIVIDDRYSISTQRIWFIIQSSLLVLLSACLFYYKLMRRTGRRDQPQKRTGRRSQP